MSETKNAQNPEAEATAERVAAKLTAFYEGLPADEQQLLAATLARTPAGTDEQADDSVGYAIINGRFFPLPERDPVPPTRVGVDGPTFNPPRLPGEPRTF